MALYYPAPAPVDLIDGGIGSIGTIERLAYPGRSPWSLFELHDLRITPTPPGNIERGELLVAEILGWNEKGEFVGRRVQDLERGYIWYKITMVPPLERIVKFQVRVYRAGTTSRVPEYLGVMLNDLVYPLRTTYWAFADRGEEYHRLQLRPKRLRLYSNRCHRQPHSYHKRKPALQRHNRHLIKASRSVTSALTLPIPPPSLEPRFQTASSTSLPQPNYLSLFH